MLYFSHQGNGSEIVHIGRHCPKLKSLRLLIGDKVLKGETTLHYGCNYFSALEHLTVEGSVHLVCHLRADAFLNLLDISNFLPQHAFAFLWGNARNLQTMRLGLVVSTEIIITNVLIYDVFQLLYQVGKLALCPEGASFFCSASGITSSRIFPQSLRGGFDFLILGQ